MGFPPFPQSARTARPTRNKTKNKFRNGQSITSHHPRCPNSGSSLFPARTASSFTHSAIIPHPPLIQHDTFPCSPPRVNGQKCSFQTLPYVNYSMCVIYKSHYDMVE